MHLIGIQVNDDNLVMKHPQVPYDHCWSLDYVTVLETSTISVEVRLVKEQANIVHVLSHGNLAVIGLWSTVDTDGV